MLSVSGLTAHYGASQVLFGVDFEIAQGEVVTLLGRNGMGKTTTINALMGIVPPSGGTVKFHDQELVGRASFEIAKQGFGLVPEGRQIFPNLSARENLIAIEANHSGGADHWTLARVLDLFPELESRLPAMGNLLSGGEQQMLAIGRALMTNPRILILDEATEGLAPLVRQRIWSALDAIRSTGISILLVDKNLKDLVRLADRHVILQRGKVVWSGTSDALESDAAARQNYIGL